MKDFMQFTMDEDIFYISLEQKVAKDRMRFAVPKSIFTTICKSIPQIEDKEYTFFNLDHNALFYVSFEAPNVFIFTKMKMLNLDKSSVFRKIEAPDTDALEPVFFKSYVDGKKVFINRYISSVMKRQGIEPRQIALDNFELSDGFYSTFISNNNNLVVDFFADNGNFYIVDLVKPDLLKFGIFSFQN